MFLYIDVTFAFFQSRGTSPVSMLPLKISHNGEAIDEATSLNIEEFKLSTPGALFGRCGLDFVMQLGIDCRISLV